MDTQILKMFYTRQRNPREILKHWEEAILYDRIRTLEQIVARLEHMLIDLADNTSYEGSDVFYWDDKEAVNDFSKKILERDKIYET